MTRLTDVGPEKTHGGCDTCYNGPAMNARESGAMIKCTRCKTSVSESFADRF